WRRSWLSYFNRHLARFFFIAVVIAREFIRFPSGKTEENIEVAGAIAGTENKVEETAAARKQFTVYTDHKPLLYFRNSTDPNSRVSRYQFKLQNFEFNIQYKPGPNNIIADCLSRNPVVEQVNVMTRSADGLKRVNYKLTRTRVTRPKVQKTPENIEASDDITDQSTEKEKGEHGAVVPMTDAQSTAVEIADLQNAAEIESCKESNAEGDDVLADEIQDVEARNKDLQTAAEIESDSGKDENDCEPAHNTLTHGDFTTEKMIFECKDQLFMRKDNYVVFVSSDGQPCDEGARQLQKYNMLPKFVDGIQESYTAKVDMEADKLQLVSGASCTASSRHCVSPDGSEAYWSTVEMGECGINKYSIIYDGYITKIEDLEEENVVYMLSTQDRNFALVRKFEENVCGIVIQHTEHTRLMIIESSGRHAPMRQTEIIAHNIDLFAYTNAKFFSNHVSASTSHRRTHGGLDSIGPQIGAKTVDNSNFKFCSYAFRLIQ
ncbi:unnamed protein product, partial [Trichogramma brassicae]